MTYNVVDIVLVACIILSIAYGWHRGFILGVLDLLSWVLILFAALRFYQPVAALIGPKVDLWSDVWDRPVAFVAVGIITGMIIQVVGHAILSRLPQGIHERTTNRVLGILPGLFNGIISSALIGALLLSIPISEGLHESARESVLAPRLAVYAERLEGMLHPVFGEAVARTLNLLTVEPESHERVNLSYKVANPKPRPDLEAAMLELVNQERVKAGLTPLVADPDLVPVARSHSTDMFNRGYFAHDTPEGLSPFDRMKRSNVRFLTAGENLALAPTLQVAHTGLMNSPGHRANILNRDFGRVGIGIMDGGMRGLMISQEFRN
jgi:uncharacterized protein YkwD